MRPDTNPKPADIVFISTCFRAVFENNLFNFENESFVICFLFDEDDEDDEDGEAPFTND